MGNDMKELAEKTERNEMRARDAEARLRIIQAEIDIIHKRNELLKLREEDE